MFQDRVFGGEPGVGLSVVGEVFRGDPGLGWGGVEDGVPGGVEQQRCAVAGVEVVVEGAVDRGGALLRAVGDFGLLLGVTDLEDVRVIGDAAGLGV
jgi:hypothetical protein